MTAKLNTNGKIHGMESSKKEIKSIPFKLSTLKLQEKNKHKPILKIKSLLRLKELKESFWENSNSFSQKRSMLSANGQIKLEKTQVLVLTKMTMCMLGLKKQKTLKNKLKMKNNNQRQKLKCQERMEELKYQERMEELKCQERMEEKDKKILMGKGKKSNTK